LTDQFYIQKVIEGDTESFRFLVNKYKDKAFSVAFSVLRNQVLAEDAVQEAFINAYKKLNSFRGEAQFSMWMMRIVVNEAIKVIRKKRIEIDGGKVLIDIEETNINLSLTSLKEAEQKFYIDKTMKFMPQREALVLQMYYLDEYSMKEMEDILDIKTEHIKVLLHRARKRFYTILEAELKHELISII